MAVSGIVEKAKDKIAFAKKVPMLLEATSDDAKPTPGYVFKEITKMTFESISHCHALLDFLLNRLKKSSPHIKFKVITILKQVSINGQSEFRSELRRQADGLCNAASFTGPLDALHGDAFNLKVRSSASNLIELLFNVESPDLVDSVVASTSLGRKMEGFGYTPVQQHSTGRESLFDSVANLTQHLPDVSSLMKTEKHATDTNFIVRQPPYSLNHSTSSQAFSAIQSQNQSLNNTRSIQNFLESSSYDVLTLRQGSGSGTELRPEPDETIMSPENRLINEITAEGGIRAVPSRDALQHFTERCSVLNIEEVLKLINVKLEDTSKDVQMKSLHVIENLLRIDNPKMAQMVLRCCTNLQNSQEFESTALKTKAEKVLRIAESGCHLNTQTRETDDKTFTDSKCDLLKLDQPHTTDVLGELFNKNEKEETITATESTEAIFSGLSVQPNTAQFKDAHQGDRSLQRGLETTESLSLFSGLGLAVSGQPSGKQSYSTAANSNIEGPETAARGTSVELFDPLCDFRSTDDTSKAINVNKVDDLNSTTIGRTNNELPTNTVPLFSDAGSSSNTNLSSKHGTRQNISSLACPDWNEIQAQGQHVQTSNDSWSAVIPNQIPVTFQGPQPMSFPSMTNPKPFPIYHGPGVLSGQSSIPLRLPKAEEKRNFDFISKSKKGDAFDFVQDEIKARKR